DGDQDILTIQPELMARTIETNALGALRVSQAFIPLLLQNSGGRIVNVSSGAGQLSDMGTWSPAYSASKTTLNAITALLAAALAKKTGWAVTRWRPGGGRAGWGGPGARPRGGGGPAGFVGPPPAPPQKRPGFFGRDGEFFPGEGPPRDKG